MNTIHNVPSYVKVEPYGRTQPNTITIAGGVVNAQVIANDTMDFYFPKGFIDLSSLHMLFKYICLPFGVTLGGNAQALPRDAECLIERLEVFLGGRRINNIANYNQIFHLMSSYGFDAEHQLYRQAYRNNWVNGSVAVATTLNDTTFCCQKWLGLLGLPIVLDTHTLGQLHVKLTLGASYITTSNNAAHSWGMNDVYMKVKYFDKYNGDLPRYIEWDDYKSTNSFEVAGRINNELKVTSSRINWALCKLLRADSRTKYNVIDGGANTTIAFLGMNAGGLSNWNISVNNNPIYRYRATPADALSSVQDIFGKASANLGLTTTTSSQSTDRVLAAGARLDFVNEVPEEVEISITMETNASSFSYMIVQTTSSLEISPNGQVIHNV